MAIRGGLGARSSNTKKSPAEDVSTQTSYMDSKTLNINSPLRVDISDDKTASEVYYDNYIYKNRSVGGDIN